jgi:phosphoglycolate phosphatase-like HAD superfamily hydrolase
MEMINNLKKIIFWDFDGVIKESLDIKSKAFELLFRNYEANLIEKILHHHESNGGVSRFEKISLYLRWANASYDEVEVLKYAKKFSELVIEGVINSPWVFGAQEYLQKNHKNIYFVLVTATPQDEIELIINRIGMSGCFREIYGYPHKKHDALANVLKKLNINSCDSLMIGDSEVDFLAAKKNCVPFILRKTPFNRDLQEIYDGPQFDKINL